MKRTWTHPQCWDCWKLDRPHDDPYSYGLAGDDPAETCAWCGKPTTAGIYVRADPDEVPYPAEEDN